MAISLRLWNRMITSGAMPSGYCARGPLRIFLFFFILILPLGAAPVCMQNDPSWLMNYDGKIGKNYRVGMTLVMDGNKVDGTYFYSTQLKDIRLKGKVVDSNRIVLDELDATGKTTARFEGSFPEQYPSFGKGKLGCEIIVGIWQSIDSTKKLPFFFSKRNNSMGSLAHRYTLAGAQDDVLIHRNARRFWDAIKRQDKDTVASLIVYPINVRLTGSTKRIHDSKELIANYDEIFSPRYRESILSELPHNMFGGGDGIMFGHGQVYFGSNGKVIVLNNF